MGSVDSATLSVDPHIRFPGESERLPPRAQRAARGGGRAPAPRSSASPRSGARCRRAGRSRGLPSSRRRPEGGGEVQLLRALRAREGHARHLQLHVPALLRRHQAGAGGGETARLPLAETPCPSCTSILDSLDGAARHLDAATQPRRGREVGSRADPHLRRGSAAGGTCACSPRGTTPTTATTTPSRRTASRRRSSTCSSATATISGTRGRRSSVRPARRGHGARATSTRSGRSGTSST